MSINKAIVLAIFAAVCYGVSIPISKILLTELSPYFMASLLYLGAGIGIGVVVLALRLRRRVQIEATLSRRDLPYIIGMILLDIIAPILLMAGLLSTAAANVSLLNNFEIVATSMIALLIFKETVGKRMWLAIALITLSTIILSLDNVVAMSSSPFDIFHQMSFSIGSLLILGACISWGFENNCTRMLSLKNPLEIVVIKGIGSGVGAFIIVLFTKSLSSHWLYIAMTLLLGFFAYGLSIYLYIMAQRTLGASRTSAYYAFAPFIGVILSFIFFAENLGVSFLIALGIMVVGTYFAVSERHSHEHTHLTITHTHRHNHHDGHHNHYHTEQIDGEHSHTHTHEEMTHTHLHTPDLHHTH